MMTTIRLWSVKESGEVKKKMVPTLPWAVSGAMFVVLGLFWLPRRLHGGVTQWRSSGRYLRSVT